MKRISSNFFKDTYTYVVGESKTEDNPTMHVFEVRRSSDNTLLAHLEFHSGSFSPNELNGILNEDLLVILINRIESFQKSKMKCRENEAALQHLYEAMFWLILRHNKRFGVSEEN